MSFPVRQYARWPVPPHLNLLYQLMAIWSSSGFSHLRSGAYHIALQTHKTQHTQPRGREKRRTNTHGLGLAPSARREKFFLILFCGFLWVIAGVYSSENPTQPPGTLAHPFALAEQTSESTGPSSSLGSRLSLTIAFDCPGAFFFSTSSGLVGNRTRASHLCGFRVKTDKKSGLALTHTHTHRNECPTSSHTRTLVGGGSYPTAEKQSL